MLRSLLHATPWPPTGYVCRACRHQRQAARRLQSTAVKAPEAGAEDWFSNFNDLSAPFPSEEGKSKNLQVSRRSRRANAEPRTRRLSADAAALKELAHLTNARLEHQRRTLQDNLHDNLSRAEENNRQARPAPSTAFTRAQPERAEFVTSVKSTLALYERALELRADGSLPEPEPVPAPSVEGPDDGPPRARHYSHQEPTIQQLRHSTSAGLSGRLRRNEKLLKKLEQKASEREGVRRTAAFTRRASTHSTHGDVSAVKSRIALYKRVLELRRDGTLNEPAPLSKTTVDGARLPRIVRPANLERSLQAFQALSSAVVRQWLPMPSHMHSLPRLRRDLESLKTLLGAKEDGLALPGVGTGPEHAEDVEVAVGEKLSGSEAATTRREGIRLSSSDLRSRIRFYERVIAARESNRSQESPDRSSSLEQKSGTTAEMFDSVVTKLKRDFEKQFDETERPSQELVKPKQTLVQLDGPKPSSENLDATLDSLRVRLQEDTLQGMDAASPPTKASRNSDGDESRAPRLSMPRFATTPNKSPYSSSSERRSQPTIVEEVREAKNRPKWGGLASEKDSRTARRAGEDDQSVAALFTDSPGDLAELIVSPAVHEPESKQAPISAAPKPQAPRAESKEAAPAAFQKSKDSGLSNLRESLSLDIHKPDQASSAPKRSQDEQRIKAVEQNVREYEQRSATTSANARKGMLRDAFSSLAGLHPFFTSKAKEGAAPAAQDETDVARRVGVQDEPAKPAATGGRKRRRTSPVRKTSGPRSTRTSRSSKATGNSDDGGDDRPLWKIMEAASVASREQSGPTEASISPLDLPGDETPSIASIKATDLRIEALDIPQPPVPSLEYGLDKVLFNPGVYQLQDPTSRVYNFDPYLEHIMPAVEFDFNALKEYKTSSEDKALSDIAKEHEKRYIGSTSSMTSTLAHFHYLLSNWRPLNLDMMSRGFSEQANEVTKINRAPNSIFLRWNPSSKTYAIDADKEFDGANVLMMLGKSMEKLLTMPTSEFEKYRKSDPREVSDEMRNEPEAFQYTTMGDFLMRSQLDAYDSRLPGSGMFDLKTRAVLPVRMDAQDFEPMLGYEIYTLQGRWNSYEREYYDMIRSTMLKYMLQARMGRMQGIFAAYHNIERIFGFQYISMMDMDRALHGQIDLCLGDQEFKLSLDMLNKVLNKATEKFPEKSLRILFETEQRDLGGDTPTPVMSIFAEPMAEEDIKRIQNSSKDKVREFERKVMDIDEKDTKPAKLDVAADEAESEDQAPTEYPPATPEPSSDEPENAEPGDAEPEAEEDSVPTTYPPVTPEPTSATSSNPDFNSSSSAADADFLSTITSTLPPAPGTSPPTPDSNTDTELGPLFAATLVTKSKVNGSHVDRPTELKRDDDWTVEYLLSEYPATEATWARYASARARRREVFSKEKDDDEEVGGAGEKKRVGATYIEFLRAMANRGREVRKEVDRLAEGRTKVVAWSVPGATAAASAPSGGEQVAEHAKVEVEDAEGYMQWLYKEVGRKS